MKALIEQLPVDKTKNFGTLEYVLDKYSRTWSWKVNAFISARKLVLGPFKRF